MAKALPMVYGFNGDDAKVLKRLAADNRLRTAVGASGGMPASLLAGGSAVGAWIMQATTAITGATYGANITPGSGTARIMVRGATYLEAHQPAGSDITATVYSLLSTPIPADDVFRVTRTLDGTLWVDAWVGDSKKRLCRFTLDAAMTTSDSSKAATITNQYGEGTAHSSASITVNNLLTHVANCYLFSGDAGDAGLAYYDNDTEWRILQMECPGT